MKNRISKIRSQVTGKQPLIHCITNPISIHQCANGILALGGRPIMAEHPKEVAEISETADALLLNIGNITDVRMESMRIAAETARERGIPFVLDAVGVGCSSLRREFVRELLEITVPTVMKGNYSEIKALYCSTYRSSGVDAERALDTAHMERTAAALSRKLGTTVLASGKQDIITDGKRLVKVNNGTSMLSSVTGTGCMLGALCAVYLTAASGFDASVSACTVLGICGQLAQTGQGIGSFAVNLMDALSSLKDSDIDHLIDLEVFEK